MSNREGFWLITGGAGYIGSHVVDQFLTDGKKVIVFDSLRSGLSSRITFLEGKHSATIPLIKGDIRNLEEIKETFKNFNIHGIVHTAALKSVKESLENPQEYFDVNLAGTKNIISVASKEGVKRLIFSSTAAVYGSPHLKRPIRETDEVNPISPYGDSKMFAEREVDRYLKEFNGRGTSLRFFNVIGSSYPEIADNSVENLVPIVRSKLSQNESPLVFGNDFETPDGTCIRDYVDVRDVSRAHLIIANSEKQLPQALNIGTGKGYSVIEIIENLKNLMNKKDIKPKFVSRRQGDSAQLVSDSNLIKLEINFECKLDLLESLKSENR